MLHGAVKSNVVMGILVFSLYALPCLHMAISTPMYIVSVVFNTAIPTVHRSMLALLYISTMRRPLNQRLEQFLLQHYLMTRDTYMSVVS